MVFDLSLDSKIMKENIGWTNGERMFFLFDDKGSYMGKNQVYGMLRTEGEHRPFVLEYNCELNGPRIVSSLKKMLDYYIYFFQSQLDNSVQKSLPHDIVVVLSEAMHNTLYHGSGAKRNKFMTIESYHSIDPHKMFVRVTNEYAKAWKYEEHIGLYLKKVAETGKIRHKGLGRGGLSGFSMIDGKVSFRDEGREFLCMFDTTHKSIN